MWILVHKDQAVIGNSIMNKRVVAIAKKDVIKSRDWTCDKTTRFLRKGTYRGVKLE